jgi:Flp pilus assembly protein TadG
MRGKNRKDQDSGVAAAELALLIPVFVLLIFGILEFGHAWYIQQAVTSASREGARYGIVYRSVTVSGVTRRADPTTEFNPSIATVIDNYLLQFFSEKVWTVSPPTLTIIPPNTKLTDAGNDLTVTVTAPKRWYVLGGLIPGMAEDATLSSTTTMKLE